MRSRQTRQLEAVASVLGESKDHPTAAEVHVRVRSRLPRVSLGTVYRNLDKLIESGRAITVHLGGSATRYDGMVSKHDHFVCDRCGGITDLSGARKPGVDIADLRSEGYAVHSHSLAVFGVCAGCQRGEARLRAVTSVR